MEKTLWLYLEDSIKLLKKKRKELEELSSGMYLNESDPITIDMLNYNREIEEKLRYFQKRLDKIKKDGGAGKAS